MLLEGLHIPLTTPFHPDGRLNLPKLAANVARRSKSPAAGLVVLGASGEPTLLTDDESRDVLRAAAQAAAPEKVLIAGISRDSVRATLALADLAAELLYDAILVGVPSIFAFDLPAATAAASEQSISTPRRELPLYFQTIADRSPLPVVLFSNRDHRIPLDATVELAAHPNILGLLDGAASPSEIEAILRRTATIKREVTVTTVFRAVTARMKIAAGRAPATLVSADSLAADRAASATAAAETPPIATPAHAHKVRRLPGPRRRHAGNPRIPARRGHRGRARIRRLRSSGLLRGLRRMEGRRPAPRRGKTGPPA